MQRTQFSKLYGVIWATSRTRNARLSTHLTRAWESCASSSRSCTMLNWLTGIPRICSGWISPSLPTYDRKYINSKNTKKNIENKKCCYLMPFSRVCFCFANQERRASKCFRRNMNLFSAHLLWIFSIWQINIKFVMNMKKCG